MGTRSVWILCFLGAFGISTAYSADLERGKTLFEDPTLGGGTSGKTCKTCHEHGDGWDENFSTKQKYQVMGEKLSTLEDVVNYCIEVTLRGEGLEADSRDMTDLIAYLKSLEGKEPEAP